MEKLSSFKLPPDIKGFFQKSGATTTDSNATQRIQCATQSNSPATQSNHRNTTKPARKTINLHRNKTKYPRNAINAHHKTTKPQLNQDPLQSPPSHSRTHHYQRTRLNVLCDIFTKDPKELLQSIVKAVHYLKELEDKQTGLEYCIMHYIFSVDTSLTEFEEEQIIKGIGTI